MSGHTFPVSFLRNIVKPNFMWIKKGRDILLRNLWNKQSRINTVYDVRFPFK